VFAAELREVCEVGLIDADRGGGLGAEVGFGFFDEFIQGVRPRNQSE